MKFTLAEQGWEIHPFSCEWISSEIRECLAEGILIAYKVDPLLFYPAYMTRYLSSLRDDWENLAQKDPLWSICTDPTRKDGKWDPDAFFDSGEQEVGAVLEYLESRNIAFDTQSALLDFGCGVGRLTQAWSKRFAQCYGVDISGTMVRLAQQYNRYPEKCHYAVNERPDLKVFEDDFFGFLYTSLVLQHMRPALSIAYLREFGRILKPGGIGVVQVVDREALPVFGRIRKAVRLRTRIKAMGACFAGVEKPKSIPMYCLPYRMIARLSKTSGLAIMDMIYTNSAQKDFNGKLRYSATPASQGLIARQYVLRKNSPVSKK